jgi:mono/diheme cytochrome c family protein
MRTILFLTVLLPTAVLAQSSSDNEPAKAFARSPKEIAFQNDTQWTDNRWQLTDTGPFLSGSIVIAKRPTLKGIAIRVGDHGQAAVCFDTARMRVSAAWTGEFLAFDDRRFGLARPPRAAGKVVYSTDKLAGWAKQGRFQPQPNEITIPEIEQGYTAAGSSATHLPKDWAAYHGLYTSGQRVVLSYSVGATEVLESPWFVQLGENGAFVRSLEIAPSTEALQLWVADPQSHVTVIGSAIVKMSKERPVLNIAPHDRTIRIKLMITRKGADAATIRSLRGLVGDVEDLSQMIRQDSGRWPEVLTTQGETTETGGPYVIDTLTLPFENPYQALFFTSGHDFFSDGSAAVCTVHGDVWTVTGIDRHLKQLRWRRFATGLHQPLGLKIVGDMVYVIGRDQITRLHDRNRDGEADFYENFNNDQFITPRGHDFVTCLDTDPAGNFYYIHAKTGVMRVSSDGAITTVIADGFRNPNGMAVGPNGTITAAPQQGTWTPESSIVVVKQGGYYGYGGPRVTADRPTGWDLPMCFIPRSMDNSGGAQVWVESDRWGPLGGQMLHLSYGQCRILLALTERVDGVYQGGTIKFPTTPGDFESGIMRGRFNPHDGQLYVSGLRGWQTRSIRDGCFQRVRYTGEPVNLPVAVKTYTNGIKLTFPNPVDPEVAENADNFFVEQWNYLWSSSYGSPEFSVANPKQQGRDEVPVVSATLMDDGRSVFLELPGRHPVMQISINWLLATVDGQRFRGTYAHTINTEPVETISESRIIRRVRPTLVAPDVTQRLVPGVQFRFQSDATRDVDVRTSRLVALRQATNDGPTPFLPPGSFSLEVTGTLQIPLSGFYDFKIEGSGQARLWINDELTADLAANGETPEPVLLRKGHNRIRIRYNCPPAGQASLHLWWKGYNFDWEHVPPAVLFHDSGSPELIATRKRRQMRVLFADHHCARCHRTDVGSQPMVELSLTPPDLADAGVRFSAAWLSRWLLSPQELRPEAHMPAVLGEGKNAAQAAADITAFLRGQHASATSDAAPATAAKSATNDGASLFESLGCIACHHFEPPHQQDEFNRLSLHFVDAKYPPTALAAFLKNPTAHHVASRMPDFHLADEEADALTRFVRTKSVGKIQDRTLQGDPLRGRKLFGDRGCQQCHSVGEKHPLRLPRFDWKTAITSRGCLAPSDARNNAPAFGFSQDQRQALAKFVQNDLKSLRRSNLVETSARLVHRLQCAHCHDRDGQRSHRTWVIAEEGSGRIPDQLPQLTWAGEKFRPAWTEKLLAGQLDYKSRPWIGARMPAFPRYATALSHGLAAEHAVDPQERPSHAFDTKLAVIGEKLTLQTGLDCRQCHAVGRLQPRGDKQTKIHLGVNFTYIRDRLRRESYHRFMLDPPRYDINTKMIRLSENRLTTKLKAYFDADAHQQFDAVWHYIQSLPEPSELKKTK